MSDCLDDTRATGRSTLPRALTYLLILGDGALIAFALQFRKVEQRNDFLWNLSLLILGVTLIMSVFWLWRAWGRTLQYVFNRTPRKAEEAALFPLVPPLLLIFYPLCGGIALPIRLASAASAIVILCLAATLWDLVAEWERFRRPGFKEALTICLYVCASLATLAFGNLAHNVQKEWVEAREQANFALRPKKVSVDHDVRRALAVNAFSKLHYEEKLRERPSLVFSLALEESSDLWGEYSVSVRASSSGKARDFRVGLDDLSEGPPERWSDYSIDLREFQGREIELNVDVRRNWRWDLNSLLSLLDRQPYLPPAWHWKQEAWKSFYMTPPRIVYGLDEEEEDFNIILISLDTLRADHLSFYGYPRDTMPNLASIAREGVLFTNFFSPSTYTLPAHMSLFTSQYPSTHGIFSKNDQIVSLRFQTLAELLRSAGYYSVALTDGGFVSSNYGFHQGFDSYRDGGKDSSQGFGIERKITSAIKWLEEHGRQKFFLFLHTYEIHDYVNNRDEHRPFYATDYDGRLDGSFGNLIHPRSEDLRKDFRISAEDTEYMENLYDGSLRYTDERLGELFAALRDMELYDKTLILITSDHGESFGELHNDGQTVAWAHGIAPYESQIHIPLIMKMPATFGATPSIVHDDYSLVDVMPSLADMLRLSPRKQLQGTSWMPSVNQEEAKPGAYPIFAQARAEINGMSGVRFNGLKYIRRDELEELYDLNSDPQELSNLRDDPLFADKLAQLSKTLDEHAEQAKGLRKAGKTGKSIPKRLEKQLEALGYFN